MAASNKTTPYELPLYESDDTTTWLSDFNNAMLKINTGMVQNSTKAESVVTMADTAVKTAQDAADKVASYDATIAKQTEDIKLNADNIQHNMQDITDTMTAVNGNTDSIKHLTDDVTAVTTTVNQHTADIEELGNEINQLGVQPLVLWTNDNPSEEIGLTSFTAPRKVRIDELVVYFVPSNAITTHTEFIVTLPYTELTTSNSAVSQNVIKLQYGQNTLIKYERMVTLRRGVELGSDDVTFSVCNAYQYGQAGSSVDNTTLIPIKAIATKYH